MAPLLLRASWSLHYRRFSGRFSSWDCFFFSGFLQIFLLPAPIILGCDEVLMFHAFVVLGQWIFTALCCFVVGWMGRGRGLWFTCPECQVNPALLYSLFSMS